MDSLYLEGHVSPETRRVRKLPLRASKAFGVWSGYSSRSCNMPFSFMRKRLFNDGQIPEGQIGFVQLNRRLNLFSKIVLTSL